MEVFHREALAADMAEKILVVAPTSAAGSGLFLAAPRRTGKSTFLANLILALRVRQSLLALPGVRLEDIQRVASHPQALAQCRGFLEQHRWQLVERATTSGAARQLSEERDAACAVVASARAGALYGLTVLAADIEDDPENTTRFAVLRRLG